MDTTVTSRADSAGAVESIPSAAELVERARAMRPLLVASQAEAEENARPAEQVWQAFRDAGFFKIILPKRYGGYDLGVWPFLQVIIEVARGCPGSAWCLALGAGHIYTAAAYWPKEAQDDIFTAHDGYFCAANFGYTRGSAERVEGGYLITGDWPFSSGSPYSTHYMGETLAPKGSHLPEGSPMMFLVARDQYELLDNWKGVLGMAASGSGITRLKNAFVPDHRTLGSTFSALGDGSDTIGYKLHDSSFYRVPQLAFSSSYIIAVIVGAAYAALDEYEHIVKTKAPQHFQVLGTGYKAKVQAQQERTQRDWALAKADIDAAYGNLRSVAAEVEDLGRNGFTLADNFKVNLQMMVSSRLSWGAVEGTLWPTVGASVSRRGARMERLWRDLSMAWNSPAQAYREPLAVGAAQAAWADFLKTLEEPA